MKLVGTYLWIVLGLACAAAAACGSEDTQSTGGTGGTGGAPGGHGGSVGGTGGAAGGQGGSAGGTNCEPPTTTATCDQAGEAVCGRIAECSRLELETLYGDLATCAQREAAFCAASLAAPGTALTPAMVESCTQALAAPAMTCAEFLAHDLPAACEPPAGALPDGEACVHAAQCASGFCGGTDPACTRCAPAPVEGGACQPGACEGWLCGEMTGCPNGLSCAAGTCVVLGLLGDTCAQDGPLCALSLECFQGQCVERLGAAAACNVPGVPAPQCDYLADYWCQPPSDGTCTLIPPAAPGAECSSEGGVLCMHGTCVSNVCVALAPDCGACNDQTGPSCNVGAQCVSGTCTWRAYAPEDCG
jgi:hypothetical protein